MSRRSSLDTGPVRSRGSRPGSSSGGELLSNSAVSCHFRYTGCYLLVIISDGCDMLRQEVIGRQLFGFQNGDGGGGGGDAGKGGNVDGGGTTAPPTQEQLNKLNMEWTARFIETTIQQIAKGKPL